MHDITLEQPFLNPLPNNVRSRIRFLNLPGYIKAQLQQLHLNSAELDEFEQTLAQIKDRHSALALKFIRYSSWAISTSAMIALPTAAYKATNSEVFQHSSWLVVLLFLLSLAIHVNCKRVEEDHQKNEIKDINQWIIHKKRPIVMQPSSTHQATA